MARLSLPYEEDEYYSSDITRIVDVCRNAGYTVSRSTARHIWERRSDAFAAGWLFLPESDDDLLGDILAYSQVNRDE